MAVLGEVVQQIAVAVKDTDEAMRRLVDWIVPGSILLRIGYPQLIVDGLDAEWRISVLHVRIMERTGHRDLGETAVEDIDVSGAKIRRVEKRHIGRGRNCPARKGKTLVNGASRRIVCHNNRIVRHVKIG